VSGDFSNPLFHLEPIPHGTPLEMLEFSCIFADIKEEKMGLKSHRLHQYV
jgi:hypothetical protein